MGGERKMRVRRITGKQKIYLGIGGLVILLLIFVLAYSHFFGPVDRFAGQTEFIVNQDETSDQVADSLKQEGFIRSRTAFHIALTSALQGTPIRPGGYELSASMDVWTLASNLDFPADDKHAYAYSFQLWERK